MHNLVLKQYTVSAGTTQLDNKIPNIVYSINRIKLAYFVLLL